MRQKAKLPPGWKYCINCLKAFKPTSPNNAAKQKFCNRECKDEFWNTGGVSVQKLKGYVHQWVREELARLGIQGKVA